MRHETKAPDKRYREKCDKITIQRNSADDLRRLRRHRLIKIDNRIPDRAIIDIHRLYYLTN